MSGLGAFPFKLVEGQHTENFYFCPVCQDLMYRPVSLSCGHTVCKTCLENLFQKSRPPVKCPSCRKEIGTADEGLNVNVALNVILNKVRIECTNEGCSWEGENGQKQDHSTNCSFHQVTCNDGCGFTGIRSIMEEHTKSCPSKKEKCQYCREEISRRDLEEHEQECAEKPRGCPYECGALIPRSHFHLHLMKCKNRMVRCQVKGCFKMMPQKEENLHVTEYIVTHQKLLADEVQLLKRDLWQNVRRSRNQRVVEKKEESIASFQWLIAACKETIATKCSNEGYMGLTSPVMSHKNYSFRCVLRKSPSYRQSANFYLSLHAEAGTSPIFMKASFVLKTETKICRQEHRVVRLMENENCCEQLVDLQDFNNGCLEITVYIIFYYLM